MILRLTTLSLSVILFITGCATTKVDEKEPAAKTAQTTVEKAVSEGKPASVPERPFPDGSLYPLLVAEFALRRQDFPTALSHYLQQSAALNDPAISAQATRLAHFMREEEQALTAARQWAKLSPESAEAHRMLAVMLSREGDVFPALEHFETLARAGEAAAFPMLAYRFAELPAPTQNAVIKKLKHLLDEGLEKAQIHLALAYMYKTLGDVDTALANVSACLALAPQHQQAMLLEAKLLQETGAAKPFARIEQAVAAHPDDRLLRLNYATLLTESNLSAARKQYEKLLAQSPRDGELLLYLALINRSLGDKLAARHYLERLQELSVVTDQAHFYLGQFAEEEGRISDATSHYRQVREGRLFLDAQRHHGKMLLNQHLLEEFSELFHHQRKQHDSLAEPLFGLESALLAGAGLDAQAITVLDAGIAKYPASTSLRYARAMQFESMDRLDAMEADLRTILGREPDNSSALNALGYTLANKTDRLDEAAGLIQRALSIDPDEPAILDSMGWLSYRQGDYTQALAYLKRAYQAFPDPEVAAHLGEVLWMNGDRNAAREVWQKALHENADHPVLRETVQRLTQDEAL
ncbi:MAG: hypothetical protein CR978_01490 [Gammaproteobacteria bacterium]|nr:MAG: hypothetical protein CR978_01490 [Gammaproteobacteria bacterium]